MRSPEKYSKEEFSKVIAQLTTGQNIWKKDAISYEMSS
jgi:hypothetical protein